MLALYLEDPPKEKGAVYTEMEKKKNSIIRYASQLATWYENVKKKKKVQPIE